MDMISAKMSDIIFDMMSDMPLIMYMKYELNYPFFFIVSLLNTTGNNIIFMMNHVGILLEVTGVNHPTQFHGYPFTNTGGGIRGPNHFLYV